MNSTHKKIIQNSFDKIAKSEGITPEEVRQEIALAISYALKSDDLKAQHFWKNIPYKGEAPTIEEIIDYIALQLARKNK